ncbi:hypothetical protein ACFVUN_34705 [Kitasatospora griseola]|uniref:hypothetical protein n=1 Tax=Kitasatospora griseola TaxID=2064 RepID=UPI0036DEC0AF
MASGWIESRIPIESIDHAHETFLAPGAEIEVLALTALRDGLAETARTSAACYGCHRTIRRGSRAPPDFVERAAAG